MSREKLFTDFFYIETPYRAQLITLPVHSALSSSRTKKFHLQSVYGVSHSYLNACEAFGERVNNTHLLHLIEFGVRKLQKGPPLDFYHM